MTSIKKRQETEPTESNNEQVNVNKLKDSVKPETNIEAVLNDKPDSKDIITETSQNCSIS